MGSEVWEGFWVHSPIGKSDIVGLCRERVSQERSLLQNRGALWDDLCEERRWPGILEGSDITGLGCGSAWLHHSPLKRVCIRNGDFLAKGQAVSLGAHLLSLSTHGKLKDPPWLWWGRNLEETGCGVTMGRMTVDSRAESRQQHMVPLTKWRAI